MSNAIVAYQIPIRLKGRLNLMKDRLSVVTTIGYTFAINSNYNSGGEGSFFINGGDGSKYNDSTRAHHISTYGLRKTYGLIETGVALEFKLKNSITLYMSANYMTGFGKVVEIDVEYWVNDLPRQTGTVFSNGNYYSVVLGVKYPISNFWHKKTEQ